MRTVGVKLVAEYQSYVAGVEASAKVTDNLVTELEKAAKAGDETAVATEVFGKTAKTAAGHVEKLDHEIKQAEHELRQLAVAFAEADTAAERADLSKGINKLQGELTKLKKSKGLLGALIPKPGEAEAEGSKVGKEIGSSVSKSFSSVEVWGPFAVALAPFIGAVISSAVIGAAGVGGVIGGVILAARDPRVKAAGTELGQNLLGQLTKDADVFVGPVLKAINEVEVGFAGLNGRIENIFGASSGFLDPLIQGVISGVSGIVKGIESLVTKGKPVMDALGSSFTIIGDAVGNALSVIAGGSGPAARALTDLARTIGTVIEAVGYLVRGLTEVWGVISYLPDKVGAWERSLVGMDEGQKASTASASVLASVMGTVSKVVLTTGEAAGKAGMQMQTFADKMDEAASKGRGLYDSQTDVAQAIADTEKAIKANGKTLDLNTQKGRDNRRMLSDLAGKLTANYDAYVKLNGEGAAAGQIAVRNRDQFVRLAEKLGKTATEANHLADEMGLLKPKSVDVHANTHDAEARIKALKDSLAGVHGKTVTIRAIADLPPGIAIGNLLHRAAGGTVKAGVPYVVGEQRPEVFVPDRDGTIVPSVSGYTNRQASAQAMPASYGPQKIIVETRSVVEWSGGADAFGQLMLNALRVRPGARATMAKLLTA